jgi:hypothetical protein
LPDTLKGLFSSSISCCLVLETVFVVTELLTCYLEDEFSFLVFDNFNVFNGFNNNNSYGSKPMFSKHLHLQTREHLCIRDTGWDVPDFVLMSLVSLYNYCTWQEIRISNECFYCSLC